tara:strand:+ start:43701 stop:45620 length:1920 start_codon:yes stop_codon:yes gene_type:complete
MKNTISQRVADFLKNYPPFNGLNTSDLEQLSEQVSIIYKEKGSVIFTEKEEGHSFFYLVHKGAVSLYKKTSNDIVDICDEGDIFGLRPLMANENYELEARAHEESIIYAIPIALFKPLALENKVVGNFLIESFASNTRNPYSKIHRGKLYSEVSLDVPKEGNEIPLTDLQSVQYSKNIVSCSPAATIKQVAETMTLKNIGAILVLVDKLPIGIITDKDLRNKIGTGMFPITAEASKIMTSPVITYPKSLTITQAQMAMMKSGISHLCLTKDGTVNSKVVGIVSKHDIMVSLGNNPAVLIKAIKRVKKIKHLKPIRHSIMGLLNGYLEGNIPMTIISKIIAELNDACMKQVVQLSLEKMTTPPPVKFAWLALGSQGRSEQMLHTDQDNALIFEDVNEEALPKTTSYFLKLSKLVTKGFHDMGYEYCPADMMASNPKWCLSLNEWKKTTSHWIINPGMDEVLLSSIFFDYNVVYGEPKLANELSEHIFYSVKKYPIFFLHLAKGALQNPSPTGFFRQFLVEQDGDHKDEFDVKSRALRPLTDAARVLVLSHHIKAINNTSERFEKLAELEPNNKEIYLACSYASKALLKFRTKQGIRNNSSGRFIDLNSLSKEEKMKLKRTFKIIKDIQELVSHRFQLKSM